MRYRFTLIEVLIALTVLVFGILATAGLISGAQSRGLVAARQWMEQHAMTQAAEYLLLAGTENDIPERFFPYTDYKINAWCITPLNLPPEINDRENGWRLASLQIHLTDEEKNTVKKLSIDRILKTGEK